MDQTAIELAKITAVTGLSAPLIHKVLGPTAEYMGGELQMWTERRLRNLGRIFRNASDKLGDESPEQQSVSPRVLARIMDDGSYCEDEVMVEYMGGVLASSRSGTSRDDEGAAMAGQVTRLSTYAVRLHYILYSVARQLFAGSDVNPGSQTRLATLVAYTPWHVVYLAMNPSEDEDIQPIIVAAMWSLMGESLTGTWELGGVDDLSEHVRKSVPGPGIVFAPTPNGVRLFMWAQGKGRSLKPFFDESWQPSLFQGVEIAPESQRVSDLPIRGSNSR